MTTDRLGKLSRNAPATDTERRDVEARVQALDAARADAEASRLRRGEKAALLIVAAAVVAGWYHTFEEMWHRWFPAWRLADMDLMDRLTEGDSYYTHGPIVPITSLIVAFFIYRRVGLPARRTAASSLLGWGVLLGSLLLQLVSARSGVSFASGFALVGVLGGLILLWGGWSLAAAYWLPVLLLLFMVPLPMGTIASLNFKLKFFASNQALWLTRNVFAISAFTEGSTVFLPSGSDGTPKVLIVENVCSGLRSLISLTFFASLFAAICRVTGYWRLILLLMAVPVAIVCNIIRITSLNLMAHYNSVEAAGPQSGFHGLTGVLIFVVALAILFGLEILIIKAGRLSRQDWVDNRLMGFLERVRGAAGERPMIRQPSIIAALVLTAALSLYWADPAQVRQYSDMARNAVPMTTTINQATFSAVFRPVNPLVRIILQTDDIVNLQYTAPDGASFGVMIVFSQNNRKGTHEPEVCIEGGGSRIVSKRQLRVDAEGLGRSRSLPMRELISQAGGRQYLHLYVYKAGTTYTPSFFQQQLRIFLNGLLRSNSAGALIRFDVPIEGDRTESARKLARDAVRTLMTSIDRNLP